MPGSIKPLDSSSIEQSIPSRFELQAHRHADQLAVGGARNLTYAELNSFANSLAQEILQVSPQSPGGFEPVAVLLPTGSEAIAALLATLKAGKIHVPLDASFPRERIAAQFAHSQARVVLTSSAHRALAESFSPASILEIDLPASITPCRNLGLGIRPDAPATIQYTAGVNGAPTGVLNLHRSILHNVNSNTSAGGLGVGDRFLPNRLLGCLHALMNGGSVFPHDLKEAGLASLAGWLRKNQITVMSAVPTTFRRFAALLGADDQFPHLRLIKLSGEALYSRDIELFQQHFPRGCFLQFSYAIAETNVVAWRLIGHDVKSDRDLQPVGLPVAGKEVLLLDDQRRPVTAHAKGEIAVRSRYLANGYWREPELTEARFQADPKDAGIHTFFTGDLGSIGPDGMLTHLGRKDSQVKIRANRVELAEVEAALRVIEGVGDAAVAARTDESGETRLAAYIVPSANTPAPSAAIRRALAEKLPDYMVPATVTPVEQLPLLPDGSVDRNALPDPLPAAASAAYQAPRTPMELVVAENWRAILRLERIGTGDSFFDLGGNSLAALESVTALERKTGVSLSAVSIASQTLAEVAAACQDRSPAPAKPRFMQSLRRLVGGAPEP